MIPQPPKELLKQYLELDQWAIFIGYRGSISHGTFVPKNDPNSIDDVDLHGLYVMPPDHYHGVKGYSDVREVKQDEWDIVAYEARKAIRLLSQGNPNMLTMLWQPNQYSLYEGEAFRYLVSNRSQFLSQEIFHRFRGYAYGQLHKMLHSASQGYMGAKRKALVEQQGYDTKNASHVIRILTMGIEALRIGELVVDRTGIDAEKLMAIKRGEWSLDEVQNEIDLRFIKLDQAYAITNLPLTVDMDEIDFICTRVLEIAWRERRY